jgi:hypothetical protein
MSGASLWRRSSALSTRSAGQDLVEAANHDLDFGKFRHFQEFSDLRIIRYRGFVTEHGSRIHDGITADMTAAADDRVADLGKAGNTCVTPDHRILNKRFFFDMNAWAEYRIQTRAFGLITQPSPSTETLSTVAAVATSTRAVRSTSNPLARHLLNHDEHEDNFPAFRCLANIHS